MKKTINQIEFVKYELNEKINSLLASSAMEGRIIGDINEISYQNKSLAKEISDVIVTRALQERSGLNKLKILYVIDSIIKNMGNEFILHLSPHIFRIFEENFIISDEESKISLFKLYYSWKYFLSPNILDSLCNRFSLNEMKRNLQREKPELIEKYDRFNEGVRENMLKEMPVKGVATNIPSNISNANLISSNIINNNITSTSGTLSSNISKNIGPSIISNNNNINIVDSNQAKNSNASLFTKKSMNESFLKELKSAHIRDRRQQDDLFSSGSSSKDSRESHDSSHDGRKNKKTGHHHGTSSKISNNRKVSQFGGDKDRRSKIHNSEGVKKSKHYSSLKKSDKGERSDRIADLTKSSKSSHAHTTTDETEETHKRTNINTQQQQQLLLNSLPLLMNPQIATLLNQYITSTGATTIGSNFKQSSTEKEREREKELLRLIQSNQPSLQKPHQPIESSQTISPVHSSLLALNPINSFINKSTVSYTPSTQLYSSISKFFNDTLSENNPVRELIRENKDLIKQKNDILKIKDFNQETYKELSKKTIDSLSTDLKNSCTICGFRTKIYPKFVEHLDIHFQINYIKRNSLKKVLYRKESLDKSSWIKQGEDNQTSGFNQTAFKSFTLNAVLFYQNDSDHMISNKKDTKNVENIDDNEQLIVPVQPGEETKCVYCGEEFKKRYINKFHYWFYVNVVKFNQNEISNFSELIKVNDKNESVILHESCVEEFLNLIKHKGKEEVHFLREKRTR